MNPFYPHRYQTPNLPLKTLNDFTIFSICDLEKI
jgi:hypothetical protein